MPRVDENTIVVGIDGSECSDQALSWALAEAKRSNRWVLLVNVWHWTSDAINSPMSIVGVPDSRKAGHRLLLVAAARAKSEGVVAVTRLVDGPRASALADVSEGAAMLVVGAHGHRGVSRALVGSVSRGCLRHARCPVVVVGRSVPARAYEARPAIPTDLPLVTGVGPG